MNHGTACGGGGADQREGGRGGHAAFSPVRDPDGSSALVKKPATRKSSRVGADLDTTRAAGWV